MDRDWRIEVSIGRGNCWSLAIFGVNARHRRPTSQEQASGCEHCHVEYLEYAEGQAGGAFDDNERLPGGLHPSSRTHCLNQAMSSKNLDLDTPTHRRNHAIGRHAWRSLRTLDTTSGSSNSPVALKQHGLLVGRKTTDRNWPGLREAIIADSLAMPW